MNDLTQGPILRHIIRMAIPMMFGMLFQTAYLLIDLYFVAGLGDAALAGVSAAGTLQYIVMAATQVLGVGTVALIAQASGRKDRDDATLVFNQSLFLSGIGGVVTLVLGFALMRPYMQAMAADAATVEQGRRYLLAFIPALALQFAMLTLGSALRGTGVAKPGMVIQIGTVILNALLAPVLIAGWGTGHPLGTLGAGLSSAISIAAGVVAGWIYFLRGDRFATLAMAQIAPRRETILRILRIGLPAGAEFLLLFVLTGLMYFMIRQFGATAQAGYGLGARVMQSIFLPAMAVAFAASPVAGQNVGAHHPERVRETFHKSALLGSAVMLVATILAQWQADRVLALFTREAPVIAMGATFLHIASFNFIAQGLIFTCSGMFQALGNTIPSLISGATRLVTFVLPALWLSRQPNFSPTVVWWLGVVTVTLQMFFSVWLLRRELDRRFGPALSPGDAPPLAA
ncbi:MAG: MATE family efflux transporter [Gemmatimonadaceae bacterium]|nr:MATE family efflux transporter [Gemmatimonadaceae bacterium]